MAILTGNDGSISIGGTVVAAVRNFTIETTADTIETSVMGTDSRTYVKGLSSYSGSADVYFDDAQFAGFNVAGSDSAVGDAPVAIKFYLNQDASNDIVAWANTAIVTGYTINSAMDGMIEGSLSFQGSGALGYSNTGNV